MGVSPLLAARSTIHSGTRAASQIDWVPFYSEPVATSAAKIYGMIFLRVAHALGGSHLPLSLIYVSRLNLRNAPAFASSGLVATCMPALIP